MSEPSQSSFFDGILSKNFAKALSAFCFRFPSPENRKMSRFSGFFRVLKALKNLKKRQTRDEVLNYGEIPKLERNREKFYLHDGSHSRYLSGKKKICGLDLVGDHGFVGAVWALEVSHLCAIDTLCVRRMSARTSD